MPTTVPPPPSLTRETHERVIQVARQDHEEGRCERAVAPLERVLASDPEPTVRLDAHWWLAQCQDQLGHPQAALAHYQAIADSLSESAGSSHPYAVAARQRVGELGAPLVEASGQARQEVAVLLSLEEIERLVAQEDRLHALKDGGVTALIVPAGTPMTAARAGTVEGAGPSTGILFRSGWSVPLRDLIGELLPRAHRQGLTVYAAVSLRAMPWLHPQLGWQDWFYDPVLGQLQPSRYLDLFNPGFQEYLVGILVDLARSGVDGLLFRATAPSGPLEGFSPAALAQFQREFGAPVDLDAIVVGWRESVRATAARGQVGAGTDSGSPSPAFWRWIGWKSRESLKLIDRAVRVMRQQAPKLRCLMEVHEEAVTDPRTALVRYGEDLIEARGIHFDGLVIGVRGVSRMDRQSVMRDLSQRVRAVGEEPHRIWLAIPMSTDQGAPEFGRSVLGVIDPASLPPVHLIAVSPELALP